MLENIRMDVYTPDGVDMLTRLYGQLNKQKKYAFLFYESGWFCFVLPSTSELERLSGIFDWYITENRWHSSDAITGEGRYKDSSLSAFLWHGYTDKDIYNEERILRLNYPQRMEEDFYPPFVQGFQDTFRIEGCHCDYLFDYYPYNQYPEAGRPQKMVRKLISDLKKGLAGNDAAYMLSYAINKKYADLCKKHYVIMTIPASTKEHTDLRWKEFCNLLSWYSHIPSAYEGIGVKFDKPPFIEDRFSKDIDYLEFNPEYFYRKEVFLIDDVVTTGRIFRLVAAKLRQNGAFHVHGLFMAKTFNKHYKL